MVDLDEDLDVIVVGAGPAASALRRS